MEIGSRSSQKKNLNFMFPWQRKNILEVQIAALQIF